MTLPGATHTFPPARSRRAILATGFYPMFFLCCTPAYSKGFFARQFPNSTLTFMAGPIQPVPLGIIIKETTPFKECTVCVVADASFPRSNGRSLPLTFAQLTN
ncbi:hypothetical protein K437DRAFT_72434 [Tilletiaria anomala UBC 951]|uniref:Uncharacterized protein n=1 Tax=Tilletiaria anomala (strain ATCC 24038 / CBS 436.72 / UBC 951) TaxID=1037660 RepID=A0A066WHJ7_TILAU|nr:uncharacterized protein K437DRAFT_72434 [Tilletiaria anomala UBC 951]KDN53467.1 hypothetical protein K437DRAFT_72434 [Tilletiaria anomala UBC 951]